MTGPQFPIVIDFSYGTVFHLRSTGPRVMLPDQYNVLDEKHSLKLMYDRGRARFKIQLWSSELGRPIKMLRQGVISGKLGSWGGQFTVILDASKPIKLMWSSINEVLKLGVAPGKISLVSQETLTTRPIREVFYEGKNVRTDGIVEACAPGLHAASSRCMIKGATWAVVCEHGKIVDVYIWSQIKPRALRELLSVIKEGGFGS